MVNGLNGASVARIFSNVRAVINLALREFGLSIVDPFLKVYFDQSQWVKKRSPAKPKDIEKVQAECYTVDDEKRRLWRGLKSQPFKGISDKTSLV